MRLMIADFSSSGIGRPSSGYRCTHPIVLCVRSGASLSVSKRRMRRIDQRIRRKVRIRRRKRVNGCIGWKERRRYIYYVYILYTYRSTSTVRYH